MAAAREGELPARPLVELPIYADQTRHLVIWILVFAVLFGVLASAAIEFHDLSFLLIGAAGAIGLLRILWVYRSRFAIGSGWVAMRSGNSWSVVLLDELESVDEGPLEQHFNFGDRLNARMTGGRRPVLVFRAKGGTEAAIDPELLEGTAYDALAQQITPVHRATMEPQIATFLASQ